MQARLEPPIEETLVPRSLMFAPDAPETLKGLIERRNAITAVADESGLTDAYCFICKHGGLPVAPWSPRRASGFIQPEIQPEWLIDETVLPSYEPCPAVSAANHISPIEHEFHPGQATGLFSPA